MDTTKTCVCRWWFFTTTSTNYSFIFSAQSNFFYSFDLQFSRLRFVKKITWYQVLFHKNYFYKQCRLQIWRKIRHQPQPHIAASICYFIYFVFESIDISSQIQVSQLKLFFNIIITSIKIGKSFDWLGSKVDRNKAADLSIFSYAPNKAPAKHHLNLNFWKMVTDQSCSVENYWCL